MKTKTKRLIRICLLFACTFVFGILSFPTYATETVETLENTTSSLQGELSSLNKELNGLSSEMNSITQKIEKTNADVEQAKLDLFDAEQLQAHQYEDMKKRIRYVYEQGELSFLQILLSSENMADFLNKADFVAAMNSYDRAMLTKLQNTEKEIEKNKQTLEEEQASLATLQEQLHAKESTLTHKITSTSSELTQYSEQLARAKSAADEAASLLQPDDSDSSSGSSNSDGSSSSTPSSSDDYTLLAALIYCEAGAEPYEGQVAVGAVVLNRVRSGSYPNSIREVIYQRGQFGPAITGKLDRVIANGRTSDSCYQAATDALGGSNPIGGALHFGYGNYGIKIGSHWFH
ncbi:MAG: cell wall hydrolase [Lachnospiraceae bacterium]